MQLFIKIENKGEVDPRAFELIGASSKKDDDSKIGFFGSGNKYSIAMLLRKNIFFKVFSGDKEVVFGKKTVNFRDSSYEIITINGKDTSMTTDMGPLWEEWFAVREFYCNALDEGEAKITVFDKLESEKGKTIIYIEKTPKLSDLFSNLPKYMLTNKNGLISTSFTSSDAVEIYNNYGDDNQLICYRKGIRCISENHNTESLYRYNFSNIKINESRIADEYSIQTRTSDALAKTNNKSIINNFLSNWKGKYEENSRWRWADKLSPEWHEVLKGSRVYPEEYALRAGDEELKSASFIVPNDLAEKIAKEVEGAYVVGKSNGENYKILDPLPSELDKINSSKNRLEKMGYPVSVPVRVGSMYENGIVALYNHKNREIVFNREYLGDKNIKDMDNTMLEENFHTMGYSDATRSFEEFLINEIRLAKGDYTNL